MRYQIEETHRHTPSVVESAAQKMRNAGLLTAAVFEALGFNLQDVDMIKKGVGMFAIAGILEIIRRSEHQARNTANP